MAKSKSKKGYWKIIYRDARTGQIVTEAYALKHPNTTVRERVWIEQ